MQWHHPGRVVRRALALAVLTIACFALDGAATPAEAQFPSFCGGENERPCRFWEYFPSCMPGLTENLALDRCIRLDSDGYPAFCGGNNERACTIIERIPSCKSGLDEVAGTCVQRDSSGYPPGCGHVNQPACTIDLQIRFGITSCSGGLLEIPFPNGICRQPDADGFPSHCGDEGERGCTIVEHIPSCKPGLAESITVGPDGGLVSTCVGPPPSCGRNGQRPCTVLEHIPSCQPGLSELPSEFGVCGASPRAWGESDASERPRGGRRTLFFIHDGGTDLGTGLVPDPFLEAIEAGAPNVTQFIGVDWNNAGDAPRKLTTFRYFDPNCQFQTNCTRTWGIESFDASTFEITEIAYALSQAIRDQASEDDIAIVAHGLGGIIARQLVYRHYDELRIAGKRITEVITIGAPHDGVLAGDLAMGNQSGLQTDAGCLFNPLTGEEGNHTACQIGKWIEWKADRGDGASGWSIDDRNYPQIRWVAVAGNGRPLDVADALARARAGGLLTADYASHLERINDPTFEFVDSDGLVTTRSGFGIARDECYPFDRTNTHYEGPDLVGGLRTYQLSTPAGPLVTGGRTVHCRHMEARTDPRVHESLSADGWPDALDGVPHDQLLASPRVRGFVVSVLNLYGDTNGDGVVSAADLTADAGPDRTVECVGPVTMVALNGSGSNVPGATAIYTWSGPFGTAVGPNPTVMLARGVHEITLRIDDAGVFSTDTVVVTIADTTAPSLTVPAVQTVEATAADATPFTLAAEAADDCCAVTIHRSPDQPAYPLGDSLVMVTATDESGNSTSAETIVRVVDTTPPALSLPDDVEVIASGRLTVVDIGTANASDIFGATVSHDAPDTFALGTTEVTWTAVDANGNQSSAVQRVHVRYAFGGFVDPIRPGGVYRGNRTLPLKFSLAWADGSPATGAVAHLQAVFLGDGSSAEEPVEVSATGMPDNNSTQFRSVGDRYHYNLSTAGWPSGRYRIAVALEDGRTHAIEVVLR